VNNISAHAATPFNMHVEALILTNALI